MIDSKGYALDLKRRHLARKYTALIGRHIQVQADVRATLAKHADLIAELDHHNQSKG